VLFSAVLFRQLRALTGDQGAREVLKALGADLALVEAPGDGVLTDIDHPRDLDATAFR
jgi:CTP:molybdopterin cytidylyltransferase MocA